MSSIQSTEQADKAQGAKDAAIFLKSVEGLKGAEWDQAVDNRILEIEYPNGRDDIRLGVRDLAEINELRQAIRNAENDRMEDAGMFDNGEDSRDDPDWHGKEEDVANWPGKTGGNWT